MSRRPMAHTAGRPLWQRVAHALLEGALFLFAVVIILSAIVVAYAASGAEFPR